LKKTRVVKFLAKSVGVDGIISTNMSLIEAGKEYHPDVGWDIKTI